MDAILRLFNQMIGNVPAQATNSNLPQKGDFDKQMAAKGYYPGADGVYRQGTPQPSATPAPRLPIPSNPNQTEQAPVIDPQLADKIREGYRKYSGGKEVPMEQYIPLMVEAAKKYPIFQKNPYLIPATSIVETSAGKNWQQQNNPLSWGVRSTWAGQYHPSSSNQAIQDMITAVGGDPNRGQGYDPETAKSRMQTASYYDQFRKTGNLKNYADTYDSGNKNYYSALMDALKNFQ